VKSKVKSSEGCQALFEIEVPKEEIEKLYAEVYTEIAKIASIPGFRVGKAPRELIEKHYSENAKEEVLKRMIPEAYRMALEEHGINPVGFPEINDVKLEPGKPLFFNAKVDTRPKFKVKNYKAIKVEKKTAKITDEDVNKAIENLREMNAKYVAVEDRPVQFGDYAISDLECFVDGKPLHKKRESIWIYLDKESLMPGLHENMIGMKKAEEKDIDTTLPEKYPDKALAGKAAKYHVLVKEIKSKALPQADDEFAKDLGKENLAALKVEISQELEKRMKMNAEVDMENQLLKKLMDDNVFPVPQSLLERQLKYMVEDSKERLVQKGFKKEELDKKENEFREKFKEDAVRQVRLFFILDSISADEKIGVSAEDIQNAYKTISAQAGKSEQEIKAHYEKEDLVGDLEEKIREGKTVEFLMKEAKVVEVAE
jgi:trigger factor